jgi:hypothetical protein
LAARRPGIPTPAMIAANTHVPADANITARTPAK